MTTIDEIRLLTSEPGPLDPGDPLYYTKECNRLQLEYVGLLRAIISADEAGDLSEVMQLTRRGDELIADLHRMVHERMIHEEGQLSDTLQPHRALTGRYYLGSFYHTGGPTNRAADLASRYGWEPPAGGEAAAG